jgi:hypothetical protein
MYLACPDIFSIEQTMHQFFNFFPHEATPARLTRLARRLGQEGEIIGLD